jgi:hypothetical protein
MKIAKLLESNPECEYLSIRLCGMLELTLFHY